MTTSLMDTGDRVIRFYSRPWFKPVIGIFLLTVILTAGPLYGRFTADGKIDPAISRDAAVVSVVVDLVVDPSTFHRTELQELGVFSGRDRNNPTDRSRVRMQNVTQENLDKLSRKYWVVAIEPA